LIGHTVLPWNKGNLDDELFNKPDRPAGGRSVGGSVRENDFAKSRKLWVLKRGATVEKKSRERTREWASTTGGSRPCKKVPQKPGKNYPCRVKRGSCTALSRGPREPADIA